MNEECNSSLRSLADLWNLITTICACIVYIAETLCWQTIHARTWHPIHQLVSRVDLECSRTVCSSSSNPFRRATQNIYIRRLRRIIHTWCNVGHRNGHVNVQCEYIFSIRMCVHKCKHSWNMSRKSATQPHARTEINGSGPTYVSHSLKHILSAYKHCQFRCTWVKENGSENMIYAVMQSSSLPQLNHILSVCASSSYVICTWETFCVHQENILYKCVWMCMIKIGSIRDIGMFYRTKALLNIFLFSVNWTSTWTHKSTGLTIPIFV